MGSFRQYCKKNPIKRYPEDYKDRYHVNFGATNYAEHFNVGIGIRPVNQGSNFKVQTHKRRYIRKVTPNHPEREPLSDIFYYEESIRLVFEIPRSEEEIKTQIEDNKFKLSAGDYEKEIELEHPAEEEEKIYNNNVLEVILKKL